ncbi:MAG TPA: M4 family metallopeptidase [Candidatus Limnocylindrales bacterium]|nr:M4 family metallopeptidase [Candidatus Limnocylindrales bacterium]
MLLAAAPASAAPPLPEVAAAAQHLDALVGGAAKVEFHGATGAARFVSIAGGAPQARALAAAPRARAEAFLDEHGRLFGLSSSRELGHRRTRRERSGAAHVIFDQSHHGLDVFGARLIVHLDEQGRVRAANGVTVPGIDIDPIARIDAEQARRAALGGDAGQGAGEATVLRLLVFPQGLLQGATPVARLAYEVEVRGGERVRELVYVDAMGGKILERITGVHQALSRRLYDGQYAAASLLWTEGDPLPFGEANADSILDNTELSYELFANVSSGTYVSYDGADHLMEAVADIGQVQPTTCPNAYWDGTSTNFCNEVTSDDIVAHEWAHAYTEHTGGLIYAYQPGALNESYSDIFGELVDLGNGTGNDLPDAVRAEGVCSQHARNAIGLELVIAAPASIAGSYVVGGAEFGPPLDSTGVAGALVLADDGDASDDGRIDDGCQPFVNAAAVTGKIAVVRRGSCLFVDKAANAEAAGAIGMVVVNNQGDGVITMAGDAVIGIPCIFLGQSDGEAIIAALGEGVTGTMRSEPIATANTWRWLMGEDSTAFGGAIRDMWAPECLGDPGRVGDAELYRCGSGDSGGVHSNSGVPNRAFSLLVDGGSYNGVAVAAIGATKAAAVYWRAMSVYQVPATDFPAHADALEQSCEDLVGQLLPALDTGAPSGETLSAEDCQAVTDAMTAVEMRAPIPCSFDPILDPDAPELCSGSVLVDAVAWDFETDPSATWTFEDDGVFEEYLPRSWQWTSDLPDQRSGSALYAANANIGDCDPGSNDQSGVVYATTPPILIPQRSGPPKLVFDHYIASEPAFDGGNVSISVNGGPFQLIDGDDFTFNGYNQIIAQGGGSAPVNHNPLAGQMAFSGVNENSTNGSWGQSQVELGWYAAPGDTIRVRFAFGMDGCFGVDGWYVDDVRVLSCTEPADGLDAFVCDRDRISRDASPFTPVEDVELFTQLDGGLITPFYDVVAPSMLCQPRALGDEDISDPETHLAGFELSAGIALPEQALDVEVDTALGRTWVDTKAAQTVLVPAATGVSPVAPDNGSHVLDTYACYGVRKARGAPRFPRGITAGLTDAGGETVTYGVRKPSRLCVAADRDGGGIKNEGSWGHLLCYKAKRLAGQPIFTGVSGLNVASDFGQQQVDLTREHDLCLPATITDLADLGH